MSFSLTQAWKHKQDTGLTTALILDSVPTSGNVLVVIGRIGDVTSTGSMSDNVGDSGGSAWSTAIGPIADSLNVFQRQYVFWRLVGTGGSLKTLTLTSSGSVGTLAVDAAEYTSGGAGTISLDGTPSSGVAQSSGPATPSAGITTTASVGLVISALTDNAANYTTPSGGFTNRVIGNGTTDQSDIWNNNVSDQYTSSASTYTPSQVLGGSEFWINMVVGFKSEASGRTPLTRGMWIGLSA